MKTTEIGKATVTLYRCDQDGCDATTWLGGNPCLTKLIDRRPQVYWGYCDTHRPAVSTSSGDEHGWVWIAQNRPGRRPHDLTGL